MLKNILWTLRRLWRYARFSARGLWEEGGGGGGIYVPLHNCVDGSVTYICVHVCIRARCCVPTVVTSAHTTVFHNCLLPPPPPLDVICSRLTLAPTNSPTRKLIACVHFGLGRRYMLKRRGGGGGTVRKIREEVILGGWGRGIVQDWGRVSMDGLWRAGRVIRFLVHYM